jgi:glycosyltransferase involved in cell wall biosynthesis
MKGLPTVCHVLHSLQFGGAEVLARQFALGMQSEFRPVFACLDELGPIGRQLQEDGVPVHVLERRPGIDPHCLLQLRSWFRDNRVSLIHAHQYTPFFYASLARLVSRQIPVLFTEHGRHYPDVRRRRRVWANRLLLRSRDRIVAVGQHVRNALIDNEGLPPQRIEVIYNGVDAAAFDMPRVARREVRGELGYTDQDSLVVQVARLNPLKDHGTAIRAMSIIAKSFPNAHLLLVGDGEERRSLVELVDRLALQPCVRFLGARNDVPRLLQAADLFLLSSVSEGIPLTLVEAMLARIPVVATRVGGVPEVIEHEVSGLLAEPGDAAGLAQCVDWLLRDKGCADRLVKFGYDRARRQFSQEQMLAAYHRTYDQMIGTHHQGESNGDAHPFSSSWAPVSQSQ